MIHSVGRRIGRIESSESASGSVDGGGEVVPPAEGLAEVDSVTPPVRVWMEVGRFNPSAAALTEVS